MTLSIIIVSYNVKAYLGQCLRSVAKAADGIDCEIFVVDNHSSDGSPEYVASAFPNVKLISSSHNLGFAKANNKAIRRSTGKFVLLLNPDTIVGEDTLRDTVGFMESHPSSGGLGVQMLRPDGTKAMESRRGLPAPMTAFYKMCGLCAKFPGSRRFGHYYMSYLPWSEPVRIEVVSGAFCMLRRSALDKVGFLDEDFFMYGEDIDLSYRLVKAGYENWYFPAKILHYKGESTQKSSFKYVHVFYEAMLIFFRKHYGHMSLYLSLPIKMAIYAKATLALLKTVSQNTRKSLGFTSRSERYDQTFVFVGSAEANALARKIVDSKGLDAQFFEGTADTLPDGHLSFDLPEGKKVCVVYDVDSYKYEDIFRIFSKRPAKNIFMGTMNSENKVIITADDILK